MSQPMTKMMIQRSLISVDALGFRPQTTTETWGDSHHGRYFPFTLTENMSVQVAVQKNDSESGLFSVYNELPNLAQRKPAHDGSTLSAISWPENFNQHRFKLRTT